MINEILNRLNKRENILLKITIFLLSFYICSYVFSELFYQYKQDYNASLNLLQSQIQEIKAKINENNKYINNYQNINNELNTTKEILNNLLSINSKYSFLNPTESIDIVFQKGNESGIDILDINTQSTDSSMTYLNLSIISNFHKLMQFIELIDNSLSITDLNISKDLNALKAILKIQVPIK